MKPVCIAMFILICGCSTLERSTESGYGHGHERDELETKRPLEEAYTEGESAPIETNLEGLNADEVQQSLVRIGLEKKLHSEEEKRQYSQYKSLMNEDERIKFLKLGDIYERDKWLDENGFDNPEKRHSRATAAIIERQDIAVGMNRLAVKDSWGDPDFVEVAGNVANGNERWHFTESVPSNDGFKVEERIITFEKGIVRGWITKK